jgi:hypothetical protein
MRRIYADEVKKLTREHKNDLLKLPQDHIARLAELESSYRAAGDLKALLAVRKERERFIVDQAVGHIRVARSPARLGALQKSYIAEHKKAESSLDGELKELKDKYIRALERLQQSLTRENKIEEALIVMEEIEKLKKQSSSNTPPSDFDSSPEPDPDQPPSGSVPEYVPEQPVAPSTSLTLAKIRGVLSGDVKSWDPATATLEVEYEFPTAAQAADWTGGGTVDDIDAALVCEKQIVQFTLPFSSISEISFEALFRGSRQLARVSLGRQLNIDIGGGNDAKSRVWQGSIYEPILTSSDPLRTAIANRAEFTMSGNSIGLSVNYGQRETGMVQSAIKQPIFVCVGQITAESAYQRVVIKGTLTETAIRFLEQKASR